METERKIPFLDTSEMSFLDHLEALRWHIIRAAISVVVFAIVVFVNKEFLFHDLILGPSRPDFWTYQQLCKLAAIVDQPDLCIEAINFGLQSRTLGGQFTTHISVSIIAGIILAFPYIFWEIWRFIRPGLYPKEARATQNAVVFVSVLFFTGVLFGYYVLAPLSINFLANYTLDPSIQNIFDISAYMSTLATMVLACGLIFQLPMVVLILSKIGLLTPRFMRAYRRHAFVIILIVAAILTPSPDVFSQFIVAMPVYFLYELSIFISASVERKALKEEAL